MIIYHIQLRHFIVAGYKKQKHRMWRKAAPTVQTHAS